MSKLCLDCYFKITRYTRSEKISIASKKEKCSECGKEDYVIIKEYGGYAILDESDTFAWNNWK